MNAPQQPLDEEGVEPLLGRVRHLPRVADRRAGRRMLVFAGLAAAALAFIALLVTEVLAADTFRQLKGREIAARFSGMELTDDVHWALVFERGGHLSSFAMGKASRGTWRVQKDELCSDTGRGEQCQQVWVSGKNVQLRKPGLDIFEEGVLQKPHARKLP